MATIGALCKREVVVATADTSVADAAKLMRRNHVGTVVVVDRAEGPYRPLGLVTDRDIVVQVIARDLQAADLTVGDIMYRQLVTVGEDEGVYEAIQLMRHRGVRRLPVVGAGTRLIGIVAIDDLLENLAEQLAGLSKVSERRNQYETSQRR